MFSGLRFRVFVLKGLGFSLLPFERSRFVLGSDLRAQKV